MGHRLIAVLLRASATVDSIDTHLARPMRPLLRDGTIDGYRLGGQVTGAWDPGYSSATDPANWRTCDACGGTTCIEDAACAACADAEQAGRRPGTVVPWSCTEWARYPGEIVPLSQLMHPGWRFPPGRTPIAWVDLAGVVWLGTDEAVLTGTDTGHIPPRLQGVFADLRTGRRDPDPYRSASRRPRPDGLVTPWRYSSRPQPRDGRFNPAEWAVAVVDAHS